MFRWEEPVYLYGILIIPLFWMVFYFLRRKISSKRNAIVDKRLQKFVIREYSPFKPWIKMIFWSFTLLFLFLALANPQYGTKLETVKRKGADIVFAIDVSKSMLAEDVKPNRLEKAKQIVSKLIDKMVSDRVGIIIYAGEAVPAVPITTDYSAAKLFLQQIKPGDVATQGTALEDAVSLATTFFDNEETDKILIILSDGEDHSENTIDAVKEAADMGIKIITVGIGTETGGLIPVKRNGQLIGYKTDKEGKRVVTKRNQTLLYRMAQETHGVYIDGNNSAQAVKQLEEVLKNLNRKEYETKKISEYKSRYQWMLFMALMFFVLYSLTGEKETRWIKNLNLFNENHHENI